MSIIIIIHCIFLNEKSKRICRKLNKLSSGDIKLTRCKSTVKAICFGLVSSANYPDQ